MRISIEPALAAYMQKKGRPCLCVEVAASNCSDFEVTELYLRLVREDFAVYLCEKKRYRRFDVPEGAVLLPPYRLEIDGDVSFGLEKRAFFHRMTCRGIRL